MGLLQYIISEVVSKAKRDALENRLFNTYVKHLKDIKPDFLSYMEERISKTDLNHLSLKDGFERYFSPLTFSDILDSILEADPTKNKKYANWLINEIFNTLKNTSESFSPHSLKYIENNINEDGGKIRRNLRIFQLLKDRNKISGKEADINQYNSSELFNLVKPYLDDPEFLGTKKEVIMKESEILYDDNGWKIIKPETHRASCFWGSGTNWCTAVDDGDPSTFESYKKDSPLYILIREKGSVKRKFQFHWSYYDILFMDEEDDPAMEEFFNMIDIQLFTDMVGLIVYDDTEYKFSVVEFFYDLDSFSDEISEEVDSRLLWIDFIPKGSFKTIIKALDKYIEYLDKYPQDKIDINKRFYDNYISYKKDNFDDEEIIEILLASIGTSNIIKILNKLTSISGTDIIKLEREVFSYYENLKR